MKTFEEWNKLGRKIHKGQKGTLAEGKLLFSLIQTYNPRRNASWVTTSSRFGITGPWDDQPY